MISKKEKNMLANVVTIGLAAGLLGTFTARYVTDSLGVSNSNGIIYSILALLIIYILDLYKYDTYVKFWRMIN